MVIVVNYQKRKNTELFKRLEEPDSLFLSKTQNYIPIYNRFLALNETNYNSINLNHKWYISSVDCKEDDNIYNCHINRIILLFHLLPCIMQILNRIFSDIS